MHYKMKVYWQYISISVESGHFFHVLTPNNWIVEKALLDEWSNVPDFKIVTMARFMY